MAVLHCVTANAQVLSAKRGFADTGASYGYLQAINAGWYYRWGPNKSNIGNFDAEFVPMFWNGGQANQSNINMIKNYGDIEWVLGFNEPEREDQANMSVGAAISAWQTLDAGFDGTGIKLISPGVSDTGGGQAWLADFMNQANAQNLQVDAVAFHWYGVSNPNDPIGAANAFIGRVDSYHNSYGLPVWVTEFAIHDWGGNYTDEEMRAANAIFLDNVIPRLESRSYVAGYAWYNWFGDSALVEGNPLTPTNVGIPYVGTLDGGDVYDFSGDDLGEHVAYLRGGELTYSGGSAGTVRYVNALEGESTISGTADWALTGGTNWVRVNTGASLKKSGSNIITLNAITVTNNGVIDINEGELSITNNPSISGTGIVRVAAGATLSYHGIRDITSATLTYPVELRGGTVSTDLEDGYYLTSGASISGNGTIVGQLNALSGSIVRVGRDGISTPSRFLVDDFESYATGNVRDVASPPWTAHQNTSLADIESDAGNNVLTYGWASDFRGASRDLPDGGTIDDSSVATFFYRFNSKTDDPDHNFGLGDQASTDGIVFNDYEAQVRLADDPGATGTFLLDARNGNAFSGTLATGLSPNSWYNVWLVVDQTTNSYDVYMNSGSDDATAGDKLNVNPLSFRNGTTDTLDKILALGAPAPIDNGVRIDDLVFLHGVDLTNPMGGLDPGAIYVPATITVEGDMTISDGAVLELDIFSPTIHDLLDVDGSLTAGGTLAIALDSDAISPAAGDVFDVLDFNSSNGAFDTINLPGLSSGLAWDLSGLYSDGLLAVVAAVAGDYNGDGIVNAADYTVWRDHLGGDATALAVGTRNPANAGEISLADYEFWKANFGNTAATSSSLQHAAVPEPSNVALAMMGVMALARLSRTWKLRASIR